MGNDAKQLAFTVISCKIKMDWDVLAPGFYGTIIRKMHEEFLRFRLEQGLRLHFSKRMKCGIPTLKRSISSEAAYIMLKVRGSCVRGGILMDFFDVITKRFSVRSYKPDMVETEKLEKILEAARQAPTACNLQAFKVLVMKTDGNREALKKVYHREWFLEAPYVLAVCSIPEESWVRADGKSYSDVDAAIVMDHIILAATALGLGTCWIGAFNPQAAREAFRMDEKMQPVALTPLGYANETRANKRRKPVEDLVTFIE